MREMAIKHDTQKPPLDPWRADALLSPDRRMIGLEAIGSVLGVSAKTVKRWALDPRIDVPVGKMGGRWSAMQHELRAWMRRNHCAR